MKVPDNPLGFVAAIAVVVLGIFWRIGRHKRAHTPQAIERRRIAFSNPRNIIISTVLGFVFMFSAVKKNGISSKNAIVILGFCAIVSTIIIVKWSQLSLKEIFKRKRSSVDNSLDQLAVNRTLVFKIKFKNRNDISQVSQDGNVILNLDNKTISILGNQMTDKIIGDLSKISFQSIGSNNTYVGLNNMVYYFEFESTKDLKTFYSAVAYIVNGSVA